MSESKSGGLGLTHLVLFLLAAAILGGPTILTGLQNALEWRNSQVQASRCQQAEAPPSPEEPERAAALADKLWESPDDADCTLARWGMTRADFVELMRQLAADVKASQRYQAARTKGIDAEEAAGASLPEGLRPGDDPAAQPGASALRDDPAGGAQGEAAQSERGEPTRSAWPGGD